MSPELFGMLSGLLVILSMIPYSIRTYQKKIHPNLTSWTLWTVIGLALLLTYKSSGAQANIWPAMFGFSNPLIITILVIRNNGGWTKPSKIEVACMVFGGLALTTWLFVHQDRELAQFALYLAIIADACAAIPTIVFIWEQPDGDRPFAWGFFAVGYALSFFAITEHTFANYILPAYMTTGSLLITIPMIVYRWRNNIPLREWA